MKISAINPAQNYTRFNSFKRDNNSNQKTQTFVFMDSKKLALVSGTLALATITATAAHIMKKNHTTPAKEAQKFIANIKI